MIEIIKKQRQELLIGLAELYVQKDNIEKQEAKIKEQIIIQRVAIDQCSALLREVETDKPVTDAEPVSQND